MSRAVAFEAEPVSEVRLRTVGMSSADALRACDRFIRAVARSLARRTALDAADLEQEGRIAVIRAAPRWCPDGGASILTYASRDIRARMMRAIVREQRRGTSARPGVKVEAPTSFEPEDEDRAPVIEPMQERVAVWSHLMTKLDEREREVLRLQLGGASTSEIGRRIGNRGRAIRIEAKILERAKSWR